MSKYNSSGTVLWAKRAGGDKEDIGKGIAVSGTSVYVVGQFRGAANFNTPSALASNEIVAAGTYDGTDIFIAKYDDIGTLQWAKRAGSSGFDYGNAIAANGNEVYITGSFEGSATFENSVLGNQTINTAGYFDIFIAKYNDLGECQWAKKAGSGGNDIGNGIAVIGSSVYITGSFKGTAGFDAPSNTSNTLISAGGDTYYSDIFIAKYNNTGVFQWAKRAGGTDSDVGYGIAVNGSSVYITGSFKGTADFNTPSNSSTNTITVAGNANYYEIFVAKFNDIGTFQWAKRAGSQSYDDEFGYGIAINGSSVYITGSFYGFADFNTPSNTSTNTIISSGYHDIFVAKYNDAGTFQWARRAGSGLYDNKPESAFGIVASNSAVMIIGNFNGTANFNTPSATGSNEITSNGGIDVFL